MSFKGHSQSLRNDSTRIPDAQLRIALRLIEQGKRDAAELKLQQESNIVLVSQISSLEIQLNAKNNAIQKLTDSIAAKELLNTDLRTVITGYRSVITVQNKEIFVLENQLQKKKTANIIWKSTTLAAVIYFIIKLF